MLKLHGPLQGGIVKSGVIRGGIIDGGVIESGEIGPGVEIVDGVFKGGHISANNGKVGTCWKYIWYFQFSMDFTVFYAGNMMVLQPQ